MCATRRFPGQGKRLPHEAGRLIPHAPGFIGRRVASGAPAAANHPAPVKALGCLSPEKRNFRVTDIFREVEEDVRRERYEKLWKEYGDYIIAGAALVVIAVGGLPALARLRTAPAVTAARTYATSQSNCCSRTSRAQPRRLFANLAEDAPGGYAQLARLAESRCAARVGQRRRCGRSSTSRSPPRQRRCSAPVARIRAAWAMVDTSPRAEIQTLLAPLTDPGECVASAWRAKFSPTRISAPARR